MRVPAIWRTRERPTAMNATFRGYDLHLVGNPNGVRIFKLSDFLVEGSSLRIRPLVSGMSASVHGINFPVGPDGQPNGEMVVQWQPAVRSILVDAVNANNRAFPVRIHIHDGLKSAELTPDMLTIRNGGTSAFGLLAEFTDGMAGDITWHPKLSWKVTSGAITIGEVSGFIAAGAASGDAEIQVILPDTLYPPGALPPVEQRTESVKPEEVGSKFTNSRTPAPAPRVGFFAAKDAPATFTPEGFALFDAAILWARRPRTLFLVGTLPLRPDDEAIRKRLEESFGFVVDVRLARDSALAHANGKHVILLSESASSGDVGSRFTGVAVPLVSLQPALFDDLKMTGTVANTDFGVSADQIELDLLKADHPLAAGLAVGRVQVAKGTARLGWGKAGANAVKIARIVGSTDRWTLFGYENGASMVGANAPARRVGCFVAKDTVASLNENGLRLFDAAISWAAGRIELFSTPPRLGDVVTGSPSTRTAWQVGVLYRIGDEVSFEGLDHRCRQQHTSQIDWKPPLTPALWERINAGLMWAVQVFYKVGDEVMFVGNRYRCIQAHQSQSDWTPPATPTLWQRV